MLNGFSLPKRSSDITALFDKNSDHYTAVVVESNNSYVGREVMYDIMSMNEFYRNTAEFYVS